LRLLRLFAAILFLAFRFFASLRLCVKAISRSFLKIICRFGGENSPCLWVGKSAHPRKRNVNATQHMIMKIKIKLFPTRLFCALALGIGSSFHLVPQCGMEASAHSAPAKTSQVNMQDYLAQTGFGRVLLHVACACRDHKYQWHWQGVLRELDGCPRSR